MKIDELKDKAKEVAKDTKKFVLKHKVMIICVGCTVAGIVIGNHVRVLKKHDREGQLILKRFDQAFKMSGPIDEEIFTELAPTIETIVLNPDIEKTVLERSYDLSHNLHKFVTVTIDNVWGD